MSGAVGRLRVPMDLAGEGVVPLGAEAVNYVTRVHRLGVGDRFVAFDPARAMEADAELVEVTKRGASARIEGLRAAPRRSGRRVTLIQGACKGDKMDAIVRDATELGATRIVAVIAARSVARPESGRADRWRRIAVEAARQCGRGDAPEIVGPVALGERMALLGPEIVGLCMDPAAGVTLGERADAVRAAADVVVLVGPEGGLEEGELKAAEQAGFTRVRLGGLVLRTETVCAAVLGALLAWEG